MLPIDGGGVRGLCSLLVLKQIMIEVERLEIAHDPTTRQTARLPAHYFDLAGGTSTGGQENLSFHHFDVAKCFIDSSVLCCSA